MTRGTTTPNRLRRVDRWIWFVAGRALRSAETPFVVDLGFGAVPVTTCELQVRLRESLGRRVEVCGVEIDPARVAEAQAWAHQDVTFMHGGFEVPVARQPQVIRAMNVLRQYDARAVDAAWAQMTHRLAPDGVLVEGTCDEIGRLGAWVTIGADGTPRTLTLSAHLPSLEAPGSFAERLPKALIHRNVPGTAIHTLLTALDTAWRHSAAEAVFGPRHRWIATIGRARDAGVPVLGPKRRWALGEVSMPWSAVWDD